MEEKEVTLREYIQIIKKRKKIILLVFCIAVAISVVVSFVLPPVYQVKSTVKIGKIVDLETFEKVPIESVIGASQLLESPETLTEVIRDLKLPFILRELRKKVSVDPVRETKDLIEIRVETHNAGQALKIANYLADKIVKRDEQIKRLYENKKEVLARYTEQISGINQQLAQIDENKKEILATYTEQISSINQQLAQIDENKKEIQSAYDKQSESISQRLAEIKDDINKTKKAMDKMMKESRPLSEAEARMLVGYMGDIANKEGQYNALMSGLRETRTKKDELMRAQQGHYDTFLSELRQVQTKKTELLRDQNQQYDSLMSEVREIQIKKAKLERIDPSRMYVTEKLVTPQVPKEPVRPKKLLNILVTALASLIVGLGLAFSLEYFEKAE
jgi:capsular polysaccharide biosynthesis protein